MKKIIINLPEGYKFNVFETEETLEIDIQLNTADTSIKKLAREIASSPTLIRPSKVLIQTTKVAAKKPAAKKAAAKKPAAKKPAAKKAAAKKPKAKRPAAKKAAAKKPAASKATAPESSGPKRTGGTGPRKF